MFAIPNPIGHRNRFPLNLNASGNSNGPIPPPQGPTIFTFLGQDNTVPDGSFIIRWRNSPNGLLIVEASIPAEGSTSQYVIVYDEDGVRRLELNEVIGTISQYFLTTSHGNGAIPYKVPSTTSKYGIDSVRPPDGLTLPLLGFNISQEKPNWIEGNDFSDILKALYAQSGIPNGTFVYKQDAQPNNLGALAAPGSSLVAPMILWDHNDGQPEWANDLIRFLGEPADTLQDPVIGWNPTDSELEWKANVQTLGIHSLGKTGTFSSPTAANPTTTYTIGINGSETIPKSRLLRGRFHLTQSNPAGNINNLNTMATVDWVSENGQIKFFATTLQRISASNWNNWGSTNRINMYLGSTNNFYGTIDNSDTDFEITFNRLTGGNTTIYVTEETLYLDETPPIPTPQKLVKMQGHTQVLPVRIINGQSVHYSLGNGTAKDELMNGRFIISQSDFRNEDSANEDYDEYCVVDWTWNQARTGITMIGRSYSEWGSGDESQPMISNTRFGIISNSGNWLTEGEFDIDNSDTTLDIKLTARMNANDLTPVYISEIYQWFGTP